MLSSSQPLITRFAPSPTGYLHLGHVACMAFVFGLASLKGAKVLLRLEDHDGERCRPEYEQAILDDMAWLGFFPDNWQLFSLSKASNDYRQSDCAEVYETALYNLEAQQLTYACTCSRKQLNADISKGAEPRYSGYCRNKNFSSDSSASIRYKVPDETQRFYDLLLGQVDQQPFYQCGDFILKDRRGYFSYQLAVVVDDIRHKINWVIRGDDLLSSTGRQVALAKSLGSQNLPFYFHHALIYDAAGKKLSKRTFAEGVIHRRERGESAESVLGEALYSVGLLPKQFKVYAHEVPKILLEEGLTSNLQS